jgi:enoyl-CoA hydratase/carnithine racemase
MDEDGIRVEIRDRVALWILARPARRNALSLPMVRRLESLAQAAQADRALRAVIISGDGPRAFCAGADLKQRMQMGLDEVRAFLAACQTAFTAIDTLDKPVIAAINGVALGGGLELALACDLRVAVASAVMGLPETALGIIPGAGGTQRLPQIVGHACAAQMILLAERVDAAEALRRGLVNRVVENDALGAALALADVFRNGAPLALAAALGALRAAHELPLEEGLREERRHYEGILTSTDRVEALVAYREKRKPVFRGE